MTNVSDEVLRTVGMTRAWVKNYNVLAALVRNAKTPVAISLTLLNRLSERDIRGLASDRNIPEPVRLGARKQLAHSQARRQ
jgi:predicted DNA-binding transcriptional regulator AlpA